MELKIPEERENFWNEKRTKINNHLSSKNIDWLEIHELILDVLFLSFQFKTMKDNEEIFIYDRIEGIWKVEGEIIIKWGSNYLCSKISAHNVREIICKLQRRTFFDRELMNPPNLIAFKNCILNIDTWVFHSHEPRFCLTKNIPIIYDPMCYPDLFEKFFYEITEQKDRTLILEIMSHCLLNDYRFQKAFIFVGEGANGKSTLLNLLAHFLGRDNVSSHTLQSFDQNQFAASELFGKTANICADISAKAMSSIGTFKVLTGGDPSNHNVKRQSTIRFINTAKLIFSANKLPPIWEDTHAIWRRLCIIFFHIIIPDEKQDKELFKKLAISTEMSGLLNILLVSLFRLLERGYFENLLSVMDQRDEYILQSDIIHAFADNCLVYADFSFISSDNLFRAQCQYAQSVNQVPKSKQSLTKQLLYWKPKSYQGKRKIKNKPVRGWLGIKLRDDFEDYLNELSEENEDEKSN